MEENLTVKESEGDCTQHFQKIKFFIWCIQYSNWQPSHKKKKIREHRLGKTAGNIINPKQDQSIMKLRLP